jgi:zinc transport system substrate-binding protein
MFKKCTLGALILAAALFFTGCAVANEPAPSDGKINVAVTFNAMAEFVKAVGKDKVNITTIIPDGMEAHDFEPKAQDLVALSTADLFVYNGLSMEAWAEEAIEAAQNPDLLAVEASKGADIIEKASGDDHENEGEEEEHAHGNSTRICGSV